VSMCILRMYLGPGLLHFVQLSSSPYVSKIKKNSKSGPFVYSNELLCFPLFVCFFPNPPVTSTD